MKSGFSLGVFASMFFLFQFLQGQQTLGQVNSVGLNELVIYKPGVHDRDLPKVIFEKVYQKDQSDDETVLGQKVVIPPTVHVHRYYYSGNKEFQGPIVAGGPTMVVARHPVTGQQMYVDVVLPAGAPKIAYSKTGITYVYQDKRVFVKFRGSKLDENRAVVAVQQGRGSHRVFNETLAKNWQRLRKFHEESPLTEAVRGTGNDVKNVVTNLGRGAGDVVQQTVDTAKTLIGIVPGAKPLLEPNDEEAKRAYQDKLQAATSKAKRKLPSFIRTNR